MKLGECAFFPLRVIHTKNNNLFELRGFFHCLITPDLGPTPRSECPQFSIEPPWISIHSFDHIQPSWFSVFLWRTSVPGSRYLFQCLIH